MDKRRKAELLNQPAVRASAPQNELLAVLTAAGYEKAADTLVGCVKVLADDKEKVSDLLEKTVRQVRASAPVLPGDKQ